jgi:hypothetical protein
LCTRREKKMCFKYYKAVTYRDNPRHYAALELKSRNLVRTQPSWLVTNVWSDHDVFFLRRALLSITEHWEYLCPNLGECPVRFGDKETELYRAEDGLADAAEILRIFRDNWGLQPDGKVEPARFEEIKREVGKAKEEFVRLVREDGGDEERAVMIWPFADTECKGW